MAVHSNAPSLYLWKGWDGASVFWACAGTTQIPAAPRLEVVAVLELPKAAGIELVFSKRSAEALRRFSVQAAGHDVDFVMNGRKLATLKLREPITGQGVMLTGPFTEEFK